MEYQDERVKSLTEILQGIMIIKLFSWENKASNAINEIRAKEVNTVKIFNYKIAMLMFMIMSLTSIMTVSTFSVYTFLGHTLKVTNRIILFFIIFNFIF